MPTLVIHEMGRDARVLSPKGDEIVMGREAENDVPLGNVSVSRKHAVLRREGEGWTLAPLSADNPVVLDGTVIREATALHEGAEIQLGRYLIIFSLEQGQVRKGYQEQRQYQVEGECTSCEWKGVVSIYNRKASCPACGLQTIRRVEKAPEPVMNDVMKLAGGATAAVSPEELARIAQRLTNAKFARVVRIEAGTIGGTEFPLSEGKSCTFGREGECTVGLSGFIFGKPATLEWERDAWVIRQHGWWPRLMIDGEAKKRAKLKNGSKFELGGARFKLVAE